MRTKFGTDHKICRAYEHVCGSGLLMCGHCGCTVSGERKRKRSPNGTIREYTYYHCGFYSKGDHPRIRLTDAQVDQELLKLFGRMRIEDAEIRQWFVEVIRARAHEGQRLNAGHRIELRRQLDVIDNKLKTLLELRMDGEITPEEYSENRRELHDRQSGIRLQLESTGLDERELADRAIAAFELSHSLKEKWRTADYPSKRTILEIIVKKAFLNSKDKEFSLDFTVRKPFDILADERFVPITGPGGN